MVLGNRKHNSRHFVPHISEVCHEPARRVMNPGSRRNPAGGCMTIKRKMRDLGWASALLCFAVAVANAQSFRVQCPTSTITHPVDANNNSEPAYAGPTYTGTNGYPSTPAHVKGAIKCQQISGGDGYATMGDRPTCSPPGELPRDRDY